MSFEKKDSDDAPVRTASHEKNLQAVAAIDADIGIRGSEEGRDLILVRVQVETNYPRPGGNIA